MTTTIADLQQIPVDGSVAANLAYREIKKRIIGLQIPSGEKLSLESLAHDLGVARSAVRNALVQLRSDGWVHISPQSGTYVRVLDQREVDDIFDLRRVLEARATRLATANFTDDQLRKLRHAFKRVAPRGVRGIGRESFDDFNDFDTMFHSSIYVAAGNKLMSTILLDLLEKVRWIKSTSRPTAERLKFSCKELEAILLAFEARDPDTAAHRMEEHIGNAADFRSRVQEGTQRLRKR